jgi:hypothetical protein
MSELSRESGRRIAAFRAEVERWNRQINLVSRKGGPDALGALVRQTVAAFDLAWSAVAPDGGSLETVYIDLGSGAGLPAFPWHVLLAERAAASTSLLVEPREKRAWFLERLPAAAEAPEWTVACGRWGEITVDLAWGAPELVLVSLKALHLTDAEVLAGLAGVQGGERGPAGGVVAILRFVPPASPWSELSRKVEAAPEGEILASAAGRFRSRGGRVLESPQLGALGAALSLSSYESIV